MNWLQKNSAKLPVDDILDHLEQAITNYIDGEWKVLSARKLMPSYRLQSYGVLEMFGHNVKADDDAYYVKVFYEIAKRQGEIDYPPGYFADNNPVGGEWIGPANSQERTDRENQWMQPFENAQMYDSDIGHRLLSFRGFIEGQKGQHGPQHDVEERIFPVNDLRSKMLRIGTFGSEIEEREMTEKNPADTPFAVANIIRSSIDQFWSGGDNSNGDDPVQPEPEPNTGVLISSTTNWLQKIANDPFGDIFNTPSRQEVSRDLPSQETVTLTLYHGSKWNELTSDSELDPSKSEQGVLWFSRDIEDAKWRGPWLVTYPLEVAKHVERVHYNDGSHYDDIPDQVNSYYVPGEVLISCPTENCRFYGGIELPEGWFFSYKVEKHIICTVLIELSKDMLQRVEE